jgi:hypothetical protein
MSAIGAALNGLQVPALRASSIRCSYPELTLGAIQYRRFAPQLPIFSHDSSDGFMDREVSNRGRASREAA